VHVLNNNKPLCRIKAVYVRKSFLRRPLLAKAAAFCVADPEIFRYAWAIVATMYRTACAILLINNLRSLFLQCGCDIDLFCQQCPHVITNEVHASPPSLKLGSYFLKPNYECFDCPQSNFNVFRLLYWIAAGRIVRTNNNDIYHFII